MGKVFTQPRSKKGFHLASSAPSIWSWLGGKTIGFVVVHRLRDLPWNRGWLKNLPYLISSVGMSTDSVGLDSRNAFTKSSLNSFLSQFSFSCFIFSWNFLQILFSVLGGGSLTQPTPPYMFLYSPSVRKVWWLVQSSVIYHVLTSQRFWPILLNIAWKPPDHCHLCNMLYPSYLGTNFGKIPIPRHEYIFLAKS